MKAQIGELEMLFVEMELKHALNPLRSSWHNHESLNKIYLECKVNVTFCSY